MLGVCWGPRARTRSGKRPCRPWSDRQSLSVWVTRNSELGAVSTGPGLGPLSPNLAAPEGKAGERKPLASSLKPESPGVEQLQKLWPSLASPRAAPLGRTLSAVRSPWPSITLLNPFAPYWAGLITCAPREWPVYFQATLKAQSLYLFLILGLCPGGQTQRSEGASPEKRPCHPMCRAAGAAGLQGAA